MPTHRDSSRTSRERKKPESEPELIHAKFHVIKRIKSDQGLDCVHGGHERCHALVGLKPEA